jgi:hypothetical protein
MKRIEWTAESGKAVALTLATERTINADGDLVTVPDWDLRLEVAGLSAIYNFQVAEHPTYGTILDAGRIKVRVPADQAAAVKALVAEYRAEVERRIDADLAASKEYDEGRERMRKVMGY